MTVAGASAFDRLAAPDRIVVAVTDSPQSLRAARAAIALAASTSARLLVATVIQDGMVARALARASTEGQGEERLRTSADALLRHVERMAASDGVRADTLELAGEPAAQIAAEARRWSADLIVVGRRDQVGPSLPALGRVAQQLIELTEVPVLVVP